MTAPTYPIPRDLLEGFQTGDEQALEHGFLQIYPSLTSEVAGELDDSAATARVVERAFLHVLDDRRSITDADSLDHALHQALHSSVVREQSRRAALDRFEHNEGVTRRGRRSPAPQPDANQVWGRIQSARDEASVDFSQSRQSAAAEAQHRAAAHMTQAISRRSKWAMPAIVLGLLALCAGGYGLSRLGTGPSEPDIQRALASPLARTRTAASGQIGNVTLPDETIVKLGAGSSLRTGAGFGESLRALSLTGTASFTVAPWSVPFELRTNRVAISLLSGRVDVGAESPASTLVRVNDGQVRLTTSDSSWTATAGQSFLISTTEAVRAARAFEVEESLGWIDGRFVANGSVGDVVVKMQRWYGADIAIGDASIVDRHASVTGLLSSLPTTLKSLEEASDVRMIWTDGRMMLFRK